MASQNNSPQVSEERTSFGVGTGVEEELPADSDSIEEIGEPFDPEKIEVTTRNMTIDLVMARIRAKAIDLEPEFQRRRGIWTDQRQSRLIESLMLKIPLPTLYAAEDELENWAIVDGIQRLSTITRFIDPEAIAEERLVLSGLEYLKAFNGKSFFDLTPRMQRRIKETELVVHLIRFGTPEEVKFNIFARINTGGVALSTQELRHAIISGQARTILRDWAKSQAFLQATDNSIHDERMADREFVLRFIAFRQTPADAYKADDFDRFLGDAMRELNKVHEPSLSQLEEEFETAMNTSRAVFGNDAFRKRYKAEDGRYPINKALFETQAVNLAALSAQDRTCLVERREEVRQAFMRLMAVREFDSAISQGTGSAAKVRIRFGMFAEMLRGVLAQC